MVRNLPKWSLFNPEAQKIVLFMPTIKKDGSSNVGGYLTRGSCMNRNGI